MNLRHSPVQARAVGERTIFWFMRSMAATSTPATSRTQVPLRRFTVEPPACLACLNNHHFSTGCVKAQLLTVRCSPLCLCPPLTTNGLQCSLTLSTFLLFLISILTKSFLPQHEIDSSFSPFHSINLLMIGFRKSFDVAEEKWISVVWSRRQPLVISARHSHNASRMVRCTGHV